MRPEFASDVASLQHFPCYDIQVRVNMSSLSLAGTEWVTFTNREGVPLSEIYFRLYPQAKVVYGGTMRVTRATVGNQEVTPEVTLEDHTAIRLPLPQLLEPNAQVAIRLDFSAQVPRDFGGDVKTSEMYGIFNYSAGVMTLANWYPILAVYDEQGWHLPPVTGAGDAVYSDVALYHVELTTDPNVVVVSTGREVGRQTTATGEKTHELVSGPARDFTLVLSKQFQAVRRNEGSILVNAFHLPQDTAEATRALDLTVAALQTFQKLFGPYPYRELDVVEVPLNRAAGVEYPELFMIAQDLYHTDDNPFFEFAIAHETAHQWWYGVVGNDVIEDPWLDEALANYSTALYMEKAHGSAGLKRTLENWQQIRQQWEKDHPDEPIAQPLTDFQDRERAYGIIVYVKGGLFFQALREAIGDDAFFAALQQYYKAHRYGVAHPADLLSAFEATSKRDLSALYEEWGVK